MLLMLIRWSVPMASLFALGPLAALLVRTLHGPLGGDELTFLIGPGFAQGLGVLLAVMGIATFAGVLGSRVDNPHAGLTCAGFVLAWAAWQTGEVDGILRTTRDDGVLRTLALEGAIVALLGIASAWIVLRAGANRTPPEHVVEHRLDLRDAGLPTGVLVCIAVALGAAYVVAREPLKGQAVAAAVIAGIAGSLLARLASPRTPAMAYVAGVALLAIVAPLAASLVVGPRGAAAAANAGSLFRAANILPMDWLAGALVGTPLGLSWAASMMHKDEPYATGHARRA